MARRRDGARGRGRAARRNRVRGRQEAGVTGCAAITVPQASVTIRRFLPPTASVAFALRARVDSSNSAVDFHSRASNPVLEHFFRVGAVAALDILAAAEMAGFADDAHEFAILPEAFITAGSDVVFEDFAFVEEFYSTAVVCFCLFRGQSPNFSDPQIAFCD